MEKKIRLNHKCKKCNKIIYIGDCVLMEDGAYHINCLLDKERERILAIVNTEVQKECMGTSANCFDLYNSIKNKVNLKPKPKHL